MHNKAEQSYMHPCSSPYTVCPPCLEAADRTLLPSRSHAVGKCEQNEHLRT